ncbi:uncharacterized protein PADG_03876 [Paracoccidioides brasiliensis Pb18]|uniref:BTB domain-containing protein n=1 Tax=Paracoccidioides brasiliensis (strain Pb18) TaxID=502780 RepID=C1G9E0_PARBD|nr:uncharacterized protein PADG_03876 [Paracoccidioides brasiliensis Pb18]EEH47792.1 hypothetical protein PADG_03876 [Paracoccidioides brasiliensis Pb18]
MFIRRSSQSHHRESFSSKYRAGKSSSSRSKRSFRDPSTSVRRAESTSQNPESSSSPPVSPNLSSAIITLCVGPDQRLFAAHQDVLCISSFFATCCRSQFLESHSKRINLPDEQPEIFSCILEFLYKGDYYPRLLHNKRRDLWELENGASHNASGRMQQQGIESTIVCQVDGSVILKDTAVYCAAEKYDLDDLKRLALRKQGLQVAVQCSTILSSARYAYANTPDNDSKLRAHYLALIIRSRSTFKRSGTMQMEMEEGGKLFFDLFVAMCNHMDDLTNASKSPFSH